MNENSVLVLYIVFSPWFLGGTRSQGYTKGSGDKRRGEKNASQRFGNKGFISEGLIGEAPY